MVEDNSFIFADNDIECDDCDKTHLESWKILIVDDEPEIHKITELALARVIVNGSRLEFLHAYSGKEALDILTQSEDIAVVLLDVVMESDDAGLKVVRSIRNDLKLTDIRIVLRTGQPGYAPEEQIVMEYDINDYKTKTELTRQKLLTTIYSAIRAFQKLSEINASKVFLEQLNLINQTLLCTEEHDQFSRMLVTKTQELFSAKEDAALLVAPSSEDETFNNFKVACGFGRYQQHEGQRYERCLDGVDIHSLNQAISNRTHVFTDNTTLLYLEVKSCRAVVLLEGSIAKEVSSALVQAYCSNIGSALDNSLLLQQMSLVAYQDKLTGLPNRARFIELLDLYIEGKRSGNRVMLLDIDHFSDINDGLGQDAGNALLCSVAKRLISTLDPTVTVARIGADIFGLVGNEATLDTDIVLPLFHKSFRAEEHLIPINATLGICHQLSSGSSGLAVLKHANIALNRAKKDLQARFCFYQTEMEDETSWRLGMIRSLVNDFNHGRLQVWYQPQLNIKTGKFEGMEALLRWPNGEGGFVSPLVFIPLAEYSGLIVELGIWVLKQSCLQVKTLEQLGLKNFSVAVNVSMPQFRHSNFVKKVIETADKFKVNPSQIELEITESVVMDDPKLVTRALEQLREYGFKIAIDDFGTGFSSLSYLQQLPIDRIKVDREFIKDIGEGDNGIIAETVITLSQKLGKETVAEGIETDFQLDFIRKLNCDFAQGYLHAKPMPAEQLEAFLLKEWQKSALDT